MTRETLKAYVIEKIEAIDSIDKTGVEESDSLESLHIDSLDFVEFIMKLEKEFNIGIPDEDMEGMKNNTVGDIIDYLLPIIK